jgi:hypothetical protein
MIKNEKKVADYHGPVMIGSKGWKENLLLNFLSSYDNQNKTKEDIFIDEIMSCIDEFDIHGHYEREDQITALRRSLIYLNDLFKGLDEFELSHLIKADEKRPTDEEVLNNEFKDTRFEVRRYSDWKELYCSSIGVEYELDEDGFLLKDSCHKDDYWD